MSDLITDFEDRIAELRREEADHDKRNDARSAYACRDLRLNFEERLRKVKREEETKADPIDAMLESTRQNLTVLPNGDVALTAKAFADTQAEVDRLVKERSEFTARNDKELKEARVKLLTAKILNYGLLRFVADNYDRLAQRFE
jgi:hypothetical protein